MQALEDKVNQACQDGTTPGAVVVAETVDGSFKYGKAFGTKNMKTNEPMTLDTTMQIASCTKLLTSLCVVQLFQAGKLTPDEEVAKHLPELVALPILEGFNEDGSAKTRPQKVPITVRNLLTHTNGTMYMFMVPDLIKYWESQGKEAPHLAPTVLEKAGSPLMFEPGQMWAYGHGLDYAGQLVERVTGSDLDSYMRDHLFAPLGIAAEELSFWPSKHPSMKAKLAGIAERAEPEGKVAFSTWDFMNAGATEAFGGHGAHGTMPAYMKVLRSLADPADETLLNAHWKEELFKPQITAAQEASLNAILQHPEYSAAFVGELPADRVRYSWSFAGLLSLNDDPGWRRKGTLLWSGYANLLWYVDRESGLCFMYGGQVIPPGDLKIQDLMSFVEKEIYKQLSKDKGGS